MDRSSAAGLNARRVFLLGALLALFALAPAILPYAGRYVTRGDYIEQQLPFILEARRLLRGGLNSYSFSTFLGAGGVSTYAFYTLGSPFVWPLALLPQGWIPFGISVMAVLKHAVCVLTAWLYLKRLSGRKDLALLGGILYAFSSFIVVNAQFYHFTEVAAFFPLILLGMEEAMGERPRYALLAAACGISALTNYYFMFGSALAAGLYFLCRFFSEDWRPGRSLRRVIGLVAACGLGCGLAGVILVPALYMMATVTRTGGTGTPLLTQTYPLQVLLERLRALLMPIESNVVHSVYGQASSWSSTAAYLPVFGMTGVMVLLSGRKNRWLKVLLAAMLIISAVPALCGLFVLESNLSYTRWWYALTLAESAATVLALRDRPIRENKRCWLTSLAVCSLLCAGLTLPALIPEGIASKLPLVSGFLSGCREGAKASLPFLVFTLGMAALGGAGMLLMIVRTPRPLTALLLVGAVACAQYAGFLMLGDNLILSGGTKPGRGVYTLREIAEPTLSAAETEETGDYVRIDYGKKLRNYGLLRGQSSLTCFNSLRTQTVGRFISAAGFGYDSSTTVMPPNGSAAMRAFLSVSEYHDVGGGEVPEGFVYDRTENGFPVYRNENALPMGFLQTNWSQERNMRLTKNTLPRVLLGAVLLDDGAAERYGSRLARIEYGDLPDWQTSVSRLKENACHTFTTRADGFDAAIDAKESGIVVFTIPFDKGFSLTVDGEPREILQVDLSFMGVFTEPGEHTFAFTYRTRGLTLGIAMSLLSAAALLLWGGARRFLSRGRR